MGRAHLRGAPRRARERHVRVAGAEMVLDVAQPSVGGGAAHLHTDERLVARFVNNRAESPCRMDHHR